MENTHTNVKKVVSVQDHAGRHSDNMPDYHNVKILAAKNPMVQGKKDNIRSAAKSLLANDGPLAEAQARKLQALESRRTS
ncbi:hypothetical protein LRP88_00695 [Fusarium phalaenopsidis]